MKHAHLLALAVLALTLAACASAPPVAVPSGLAEGVALYDKGDYDGAIARLGRADVIGAATATRLEAFKYSAFSYCLTRRPGQCRQQFDQALKLDPGFDLAPGEYGHPLWGPVFLKAKKKG